MKPRTQISPILITVVLLAVLGAPASAQRSLEFGNGNIVLQKGEEGDGGYWTTNAYQTDPVIDRHQILRKQLMQRHALEEYAEFLSPLRLPYTLHLYASDCSGGDDDSPYYDPSERAIDMCYGFLAMADEAADILIKQQKSQKLWTPVSREQYLAGLYAAVLLHETGHALFDVLDVPVFGREEDAADQIAAFIALQFGKKDARTIIKGFAYFWQAQTDPSAFGEYRDVHGTASQRLYNILCIAYGGDPVSFQDFVDSGWLPRERAADCPREYQQAKLAFEKTILPFIDQGQMRNVQARQWFLPSEVSTEEHGSR